MFWLGTALMLLVASALALRAILFASRAARNLGSLSNDWLARHRLEDGLGDMLHADQRGLLAAGPFDSRRR